MKLINSLFKYAFITTLLLLIISNLTFASDNNDDVISTTVNINKENIDKIYNLIKNANKSDVILSDNCKSKIFIKKRKKTSQSQNIEYIKSQNIKYIKREKKDSEYINSILEKLIFYKDYFLSDLKDKDYYFLTAKKKIPLLIINGEKKHIRLIFKNTNDLEFVVNGRDGNNPFSFLLSRNIDFRASEINDLNFIYFEAEKNYIYYLHFKENKNIEDNLSVYESKKLYFQNIYYLHFKENKNIEDNLLVYESDYRDYLALQLQKKNYIFKTDKTDNSTSISYEELIDICTDVKIKITYEF